MRKQTEERTGKERLRATEKSASVVIHFEDTALDDAHVSVPHNLVSEGQKQRQREHRVKCERFEQRGTVRLGMNCCEIWVKRVNEAILVHAV